MFKNVITKLKKKPKYILIIVALGISTILLFRYANIGYNTLTLPPEMNGGSSGEDGTFAPYAIVVYPEANAEIGYIARTIYEPYTYQIPVKLVLHDYDGDLKYYTIDWKVVSSWGIIENGADAYARLTSGTIYTQTYDREISTSVEYEFTWEGVRPYTNVIFTLSFKFHIEDFYGNVKDIEQDRVIDGQISEEKDIQILTTDVIEDNTEDSNPPAEDYFDDPAGNWDIDSIAPSFELFVTLPAIVLLTVLFRRHKHSQNLRDS